MTIDRTRDVGVVADRDHRIRIGPWRDDLLTGHIVIFPSEATLTGDDLDACLGRAISVGYHDVITSALMPREQELFLRRGFEVREELHLLRHGLAGIARPRRPTRRARRRDHERVLIIDKAAFSPFWQLDHAGLRDALGATPSSRFRVVGTDPVDGYAISGHAADTGYLQRLAVHPQAESQGWGAALVHDALWWMARRGARVGLVNTQIGNDRALQLYERAGFAHSSNRLAVLGCRLTGEWS